MSGNGQQLPVGWANASLAQIVEPRSGKADPQAMPEAKFIGMEQVEAHTMRLLGTVPASSMKSSANAFQPADVLYGRLRPYLNKVYQPDFAGFCSGEFIVMPESGAVLGKFLKYRLNAGDFVRFASRIHTGDRPRVDFDQIKIFDFLLPPKPEQERIADALDELFSDLDAGVAALERVREKLKLYRASVLKATVEGALTTEWRAQHPHTETASELVKRILAERRRRWEEDQVAKFKAKGQEPPKNWKAKYKEPVAPKITNLPPLPEGWCWATVDQLLASPIINGLSVRGSEEPPGIPALRLSAMTDKGFDYSERRYLPLKPEDADDLWIRPGDFFVSRGNGTKKLVGRGTLAQQPPELVIFPDTMMRIRFLHSHLSPNWIPTIWGSGLVHRQIERIAKTTAGIWKIAQPNLAGVTVPVPPVSEQEAIIEAVEDQLSVIERLEADLDAKLKGVQALRQAILGHAFTGKLVPQDPNDEPASELLKRIAAERETRARAAARKPGGARKRVRRALRGSRPPA
jgi:type I restriction enzyme S subunit